MDLAGEIQKNTHGSDRLGFAILNGIEEVLEMSGINVFVYALRDDSKSQQKTSEAEP